MTSISSGKKKNQGYRNVANLTLSGLTWIYLCTYEVENECILIKHMWIRTGFNLKRSQIKVQIEQVQTKDANGPNP